MYLKQHADYSEIYPTELGWLVYQTDSYLLTDGLDFNNLHQMAVSFEVFPVTSVFEFKVFLRNVPNLSTPMEFAFSESSITLVSPTLSTTSQYLQAQKWNRVFISFYQTLSNDVTRVKVYFQTLEQSSSSTITVEEYSLDLQTSTMGLTGATIEVVYTGVNTIIKQLEFYKYGINMQTIMDMGPYSYSGDKEFTFQRYFYSRYMSFFATPPTTIVNASNQ